MVQEDSALLLIYLRPVNKVTIASSWPMPYLESELSRVAGSQIFSTFDLCHGYWQLELSESSRDCQSFITPDGIYTPTSVLHGASNAVSHMQSPMQGILGDLSADILAWLDDLLLHSRDECALIANLRRFFTLCREFSLKLHQVSARYMLWKRSGAAVLFLRPG
jgi:Reverse transcriptase (RNA-dependent DNA polymerase)